MASRSNAPRTEVWTSDEVADYLGVSSETVRTEAKKGAIPGFRVGTLWRFRAEIIRSLGYTAAHAPLSERQS